MKSDKLKQIYPVAGLALAVLPLFNGSYPPWVPVAGSLIGGALVLAWLFSEAGWIGHAIKFRWFKSKLSSDHAVRLEVLLDDINNFMSESYTRSPFHVWNNCANKYPGMIRMNYSYHTAIRSWMEDLKDKLLDPAVNNALLINSLSRSVAEANKLAGFSETELNELFRNKEFPSNDRDRILKEWDSAKNGFNQWIDKWRTLFMEINKTQNINCVEFYRSLEMIG